MDKPARRFVKGAIVCVALLLGADLAPVRGAAEGPARPLSVLVLLGEWFGDAYFPLAREIEARGWTLKRIGVDAEYRGCYNKARDVVLRSDILIPDLKDLAAYDALIIPSGPQWRKFNENPAVLAFVRNAHAAGLIVASFCVGNTTVKAAGLVDLPAGPELYPAKVTLVKERVLLGPRGGGPPPGDGFESAPIKEICDAVARERSGSGSLPPSLTGPYLGQKPPGMTPEVFAPGLVSKDGDQGRLFIAPDGSEIIYWERDAGGRMRILSVVEKGGTWSAPEALPFSEEYVNNEPCLSPDGKKLFFVSNRPRAGTGEAEKFPDLWMAEKSAGTWGEPMNLGDPVNRLDIVVQPFYTVDDTLYFGGQAADGSSRGIYVSRYGDGAFSEPERLDPDVFDRQVSGPCVSPDNRTLIVHARKEDGFGNWDLYASFRDAAGRWGPLVNLGSAVNTEAAEAGASFSPDGKFLFFSRGGDIYWVSTGFLGRLRSKLKE